MSWYAYDAKGYCGDIASIGGWRDFATFMHSLGGEAASFVMNGHTDKPQALAKQLDAASAAGSNESIRKNLASIAKSADAVLILSDGVDIGDEGSKSVIQLTKEELAEAKHLQGAIWLHK